MTAMNKYQIISRAAEMFGIWVRVVDVWREETDTTDKILASAFAELNKLNEQRG